ncbi:MAG: diguanylate cyclase [Oleiphilaceae bacterium]|nr:diguanylate cyclase [Oleiphilaceae bacterium]
MLTDKELLRLTHTVTDSGHWTLNLRDQSLFWSSELFRLHGCPPGSPQPDLSEAIAFCHPEDREFVQEAVEQALQTNGELDFVARIVRADGEVRHFHSRGKVKFDEAGEPHYLFGLFRDITEDWLARKHSQRLANVLEDTDEIIFLTDPLGRVNWANSAFTRVTGYPLAQIMGRKPGSLLQGPDTDPETVACMRHRLDRREPFTTEILNYRKDGAGYWVRISCQPDFGANDELLGFAAIQTDITAEKEVRLDLQREVESRKKLEYQLRYLARHDELSGMPNRRYFMQRGDTELNRARRYHNPVSLVLVDLDHFKRINDQHGHKAGDEVIQAFAALCQKTLREQDMAARIGGEEFVLLLPETGLDGARTLAERLREELAGTAIRAAGADIPVTASMGVVEALPETEALGSLLARADRALYRAKGEGRNRVHTDRGSSQ